MSVSEPQIYDPRLRLCIHLSGVVQGVGFRPFVWRLAQELKVCGWVANTGAGLNAEIEGSSSRLECFLSRMRDEKPACAHVASESIERALPVGYSEFTIRDFGRETEERGKKTAWVSPDLATCKSCLEEMRDPNNRRYRYPFINCTQCGPRFTIIESLPYARERTTMKSFLQCKLCSSEFGDPTNRRFHAEPNACPTCGPTLSWWSAKGNLLSHGEDAFQAAVRALESGQIVAIKGIGGFHLMVDARNEAAVMELRRRKCREEKPFAVLFPNINFAKAACKVSDLEQETLQSQEGPIVILKALEQSVEIARAVAPGLPWVGAMLPSNPLHHLLMDALGFPLVATSGNLTEDPLCIDERDAILRLGDIADGFLVHNRPIARRADDSVVRIVCDRPLLYRMARGYAPMSRECRDTWGDRLAVGGHLKNTVALAAGKRIFLSSHIGDLHHVRATNAFEASVSDLTTLYGHELSQIACDAHPEYFSTGFAARQAKKSGTQVVYLQHHAAHIAACLVDNNIRPPVLGVAWDGSGDGGDGSVWGGEFVKFDGEGIHRVAHLRQFPMPGGEKAVREPRRLALSLLFSIGESSKGSRLGFTEAELSVLLRMIQQRINSPLTSSVGRLFDGVASLLGICQVARYEGQGAILLEAAAEPDMGANSYNFSLLNQDGICLIDWEPLVRDILADQERGEHISVISARFHSTLADMIVAVVKRIDEARVALSGGCFQNKLLTELTILRLRIAGFEPYWHRNLPPNDGNLAIGQLALAAFKDTGEFPCV